MHQKASGFSLIELSIVLMIIGLVAGSILVSRSLVRAGEIRQLHGQYTQFGNAMLAFRMKYGCMAGDCDHATDFFAPDPLGCPPPNGALPSDATCNGDGDGELTTHDEGLEAWRQLANAGFIEGRYSGARVYVDASFGLRAGQNCPRILSDAHCWTWWGTQLVTITILPSTSVRTQLTMFPTNPTVTITFDSPFISSAYAMGNLIPRGSHVLTPAEAMGYDQKYDDAWPASGHIQALSALILNACTTTQDAAAQYDVTLEERTCSLIYELGF